MEELMNEYLEQTTDSVSSEHRDHHSDCDLTDGRPGGGHTEYDHHTDDDDDYQDRY